MTSLALQPFTIFKALLYTGLHLVLVSSFHMFVSYNDQRHTGNTWVAELSLKPGPQTLPKTKAPALQTGPPTRVWEPLPYCQSQFILNCFQLTWCDICMVRDMMVAWVRGCTRIFGEDSPRSSGGCSKAASRIPLIGGSPGGPPLLQSCVCDRLWPVDRAFRGSVGAEDGCWSVRSLTWENSFAMSLITTFHKEFHRACSFAF